MSELTVFPVDDNPLVRAGVRALLEAANTRPSGGASQRREPLPRIKSLLGQ